MKTQKIYTLFLTVIFTALCASLSAQPAWTVNPNAYIYSMTITGKIEMDGTSSTNTNDMVAAFINGECRGVAKVQYQKTLDDYFVFLMIYSNEPVGTVSFRVYDAAGDAEFTAKETINFTVNDIIGSVGKPFVFSTRTLSNEAKLLTFTIPNQVGKTRITGNNVYLETQWDGGLQGIVVTFTTSINAKVRVNGVLQVSGTSANDFTAPLKYTVESEDGSTFVDYMVHIKQANVFPTDILLSKQSIEENQEGMIGILTTNSADPTKKYTYSFVNATEMDNDAFLIKGDELWPKMPFNFEEKALYRIFLKAEDGKGSSFSKPFTITILDVNDAPTDVMLINTVNPEDGAMGIQLGVLLAIDEDKTDSHTFQLMPGNGTNDKDNAKFYIEGDKLKNNVPVSYTDGKSYQILVKATDSKGATVEDPLVLKTPENGSSPTNIALSNTTVNTIDALPAFVGTFSTEDLDQDSGHVFTLPFHPEAGADNESFQIAGDSLVMTQRLPIAEKQQYEIRVAVSDSMGNTFAKNFIIKVKEKHDAGFYLSNNRLQENKGENTIVGYFISETYQSSEFQYNLPLEVDLGNYRNQDFFIRGRTLLTTKVFDYESETSVDIQVEVSNDTQSFIQDITIHIEDVNDAPTGIELSNRVLSESTVVNTAVATLTAVDQDVDDTHQFSLAPGNGIVDAGNAYFKIENDQLLLRKALDFEENEFLSVLLKVTDREGASFEQGIRLQVVDANDAPKIMNSAPAYVLQNEVYVYVVEVKDSEGDTISLSFDGLPDWLTFHPDANLLSGTPGNEHVGSHSFMLHASDGNKETVQQIHISVINVNDPPEINYYLGAQHFFAEQVNGIVLPADLITDPDVGDELKFGVSGENNTALPVWLNFDPEEMKLSGTPPEGGNGVYRLKLTATDKGKLKEWMIFELIVGTYTAIGQAESKNLFSVYPNPVANDVFVTIPQGKKWSKITITNSTGQLIKTAEVSPGSKQIFRMGDVLPGIYFISLFQDKNKQVRKVIKE